MWHCANCYTYLSYSYPDNEVDQIVSHVTNIPPVDGVFGGQQGQETDYNIILKTNLSFVFWLYIVCTLYIIYLTLLCLLCIRQSRGSQLCTISEWTCSSIAVRFRYTDLQGCCRFWSCRWGVADETWEEDCWQTVPLVETCWCCYWYIWHGGYVIKVRLILS